MNPFAIGAGLAIAYSLLLMAKSSKDTLKANALRVQIADVDLDWKRIRFVFNIQNPTNGNLVIRSIVGDLFINENKVANVTTFGHFVIPANGQNQIPVQGAYINNNVAQFLMQIFNGKQRYEIIFNGTANLNSEIVPIKISFTYGR